MRNLFVGTILATSLSWATVSVLQEPTDLAEIQLVVNNLEQRVSALENENFKLRRLLVKDGEPASPPTTSLDDTLRADYLAMPSVPDLETELRLRDLEEKTALLEESTDLLEEKTAAIDVSNDGRELTFSGVNVHIVDRTGSTLCSNDICNGLGNLIIGYDEVDPDSQKIGSHNLIMGSYNSYANAGGIVTGEYNEIYGPYAMITGGYLNIAVGYSAFIATGVQNMATGSESSVLGGRQNTSTGHYSSTLGGYRNSARGWYSTVWGGRDMVADGDYATAAELPQ